MSFPAGECEQVMAKKTALKKLGWKPDLPDQRDLLYSASLARLRKLPEQVDLRKGCPPVYDQGEIGSCTANAIAAAVQFNRGKNGQKPDFIPSRLFIYYNERVIERSVAYDAGATLRDGVKSVAKLGVCPESEWPYDDTGPIEEGAAFPAKARAAQKPTAKCYRDALPHRVMSYHRIAPVLAQMKACLADGYPFVLGFTVYSRWYERQTADISMPGRNESAVGGHAVLAVGYDDASQRFTVRNSWGKKAGDKGYFYMPYAYLLDSSLARDFWTVRSVAG